MVIPAKAGTYCISTQDARFCGMTRLTSWHLQALTRGCSPAVSSRLVFRVGAPLVFNPSFELQFFFDTHF